MSTVNLTIDATKSDLPAGTEIYVYIVGLVSSTSDTYYYFNSNGVPTEMHESDNTNAASTFPNSDTLSKDAKTQVATNYPLAWADYSIPVSQTEVTTINLGNINTNHCPNLGTGTAAFSGRIYFSVGVPRLPFSPIGSPATGYTAPIPGVGNGSQTLFDWIEFSYDSAGNFNGNTTNVDQFGFPLTLDGTPGGTLQGVLNASRPTIIAKFGDSMDNVFGKGVLQYKIPSASAEAYPPNTNYFRVISPKTVVGPAAYNGPLKTYFDTIIANLYSTWETTPLVTHDANTGYYTGIVPTTGDNKGKLVCYQGNYPTLAALQAANPSVAFIFNQITTYDVWQCENSLAAGGTEQKNVGKMIAAAINRGVMASTLDDATCENNSANFYPSGVTHNNWSKVFHDVSKNGLAYGFPYDDVCNQNPSISLVSTKSVAITIGKFFS